MNLRHFALFTIALPISIAIGVALRTADIGSATVAPAAIVAASTDSETYVSAQPQVPAVRVSRRDAAALRTGARRPVATVGRLIPLAQADDSTRWR